MICSLNSFSLIPKLLATSSGYCKFLSTLNICIYLVLPNPSIHSVLVVTGILILSLAKANLYISSSSYSIIDCISLNFCFNNVSSTALVSVNNFPNLPRKNSLSLTVVSKCFSSMKIAFISSGVGSGSTFSGSLISTFGVGSIITSFLTAFLISLRAIITSRGSLTSIFSPLTASMSAMDISFFTISSASLILGTRKVFLGRLSIFP
ncbi:hypothetical protein ES705_30649 [subsurface metagenome]